MSKINKNFICKRCSLFGHTTECCQEELPSVESFKEFIDQRITRAISECSQGWSKDNYGYFQPVSIVWDGSKNFSNTKFCLNCGEEGHVFDECEKSRFDSVREIYDKVTASDVDQFVSGLYKYLDHDIDEHDTEADIAKYGYYADEEEDERDKRNIESS